MEAKINPRTQDKPATNGPWLSLSVVAWLIITALYVKEQSNNDTFSSTTSYYPSLLLIPAILLVIAAKTKPSATPKDQKILAAPTESKVLPSSPSSIPDQSTNLLGTGDVADEVMEVKAEDSEIPAPPPLSRLQRLCEAVTAGADLLPTVYLVQSIVGLLQNLMAENKSAESYTFTVIAGLATGALLDIALSTVETYKIGLTSVDLIDDKPAKGIIYIGIKDDLFTYTVQGNHGEIYRDIPIPKDKLGTSKLPDQYPKLLIAALNEHLPTILAVMSKNGHIPNDPKLRRYLDTLIANIRNNVLLAIQFVFSRALQGKFFRELLPGVKKPSDVCMSAWATGYNWAKFLASLIKQLEESYSSEEKAIRPRAQTVWEGRADIPVVTCPPIVFDCLRSLLGAGLMASAFYLKGFFSDEEPFQDPEGLLNWSAHWLNSIGGYFLGSGVGGPLARLLSLYVPNYGDRLSAVSNNAIPLLIVLEINPTSAFFLTAAGVFCKISNENTNKDLSLRLQKRLEIKDKLKTVFEENRLSQHLRKLFDVWVTPKNGPISKQHITQYLSLRKLVFNLVFFSYMVYKLALIYPTWKSNGLQNAAIDIITSFNVAAALISFNFVFPKLRPKEDDVDFLKSRWKKLVFDHSTAFVFVVNVAFKMQNKLELESPTSTSMAEVANAFLVSPPLMLFAGIASKVYDLEVYGLDNFSTDDLTAFTKRVAEGHGKVNEKLLEYFFKTYGSQLKEMDYDREEKKMEQPSLTEERFNEESQVILASQPTDMNAPLLGRVSGDIGFFKKSPTELTQPTADVETNEEVTYGALPPKDRHGNFERGALSGAIRSPVVFSNLSKK